MTVATVMNRLGRVKKQRNLSCSIAVVVPELTR